MDEWEVIRFLHLLGVAFFVGGQLMLAIVVTPALRGADDPELMRGAARRFGIGSLVALIVIIATGAAMASHYHRWGDSVLQAKIALLFLVFVLTGLHTATPYTRLLSLTTLALSIAIVYLGVDLAHF